ncbi:GFA family protein [Aurantiacibacter sp. MUD11]|uniref:GFA family protein n=1 Tax=Aurantiacibacter sp. MUD11 TaxID=3003265 RepID=UPI0022AA2521|nr:GFA family protein [Aurantiacibacter sp. MUD11]WAT19149.1 GFA family protein [Aurantiacibacter sp. MUD11]
MSVVREGGCACGQVRLRISGEPMMVHNCHCHQCQRQTGSTSVVNGFWESDNVEFLSGETREASLPGGSGNPHIIVSCAQCSSPLLSYYGRLGRLMSGVRAGALDEPGSITPDVAIFTLEKMPWVTLPEGIPAFDYYYDPREVLPEASLDRLRELGVRRKAGEG